MKNPMYNPALHNRRYHRLRNYDYSQPGWYFVTICLRDMRCLLTVVDRKKCNVTDGIRRCEGGLHCLRLSAIGQVADAYWREIPSHSPDVVLDEYVIMPDHMHGIIRLTGSNNGYNRGAYGHDRGIQLNASAENVAQETNMYSSISPKSGSLAVIVRTFKGAVKKWANRNGFRAFQWQRDFNDRIIRDALELQRIREYIRRNPCRKLENMHCSNARKLAER